MSGNEERIHLPSLIFGGVLFIACLCIVVLLAIACGIDMAGNYLITYLTFNTLVLFTSAALVTDKLSKDAEERKARKVQQAPHEDDWNTAKELR